MKTFAALLREGFPLQKQNERFWELFLLVKSTSRSEKEKNSEQQSKKQKTKTGTNLGSAHGCCYKKRKSRVNIPLSDVLTLLLCPCPHATFTICRLWVYRRVIITQDRFQNSCTSCLASGDEVSGCCCHWAAATLRDKSDILSEVEVKFLLMSANFVLPSLSIRGNKWYIIIIIHHTIYIIIIYNNCVLALHVYIK